MKAPKKSGNPFGKGGALAKGDVTSKGKGKAPPFGKGGKMAPPFGKKGK